MEVLNIFNSKISFIQKRPCVLRDFVPRGVFLKSRGGRILRRNTDSDNIINVMVFYAPNQEEVGKEDGIEMYKKVWGYLASQLSIAMP